MGESSPLVRLFELAEPILRAVEKYLTENQDKILAAAVTFMGIDALDEAGWLPHPAIRFEEFGHGIAPVEAEAEMRYREASQTIELQLLTDLTLGGFSAAAAAPLREAVEAHRQGLYRASTRLVFPALEALVRTEILGNRWGSQAGLKRLRQAVMSDDTLSFPRPMLVSVKLWEKLDAHCFDKVETSDAFDRFTASHIPNRHACLHGIIDYRTFQHSVNGLILAQYVIQLTQLLRKPKP